MLLAIQCFTRTRARAHTHTHTHTFVKKMGGESDRDRATKIVAEAGVRREGGRHAARVSFDSLVVVTACLPPPLLTPASVSVSHV